MPTLLFVIVAVCSLFCLHVTATGFQYVGEHAQKPGMVPPGPAPLPKLCESPAIVSAAAGADGIDVERTLVLIKPDAVQRGLIGRIIR
jgi:hypothetical protein